MKPQLIKSIVNTVCPSCSHEINVCISFINPGLAWVITQEEMDQNKRKLKETLKLITFKSKNEEKKTIAWIDSEDYVLGSEDIEDEAKRIEKEQKE